MKTDSFQSRRDFTPQHRRHRSVSQERPSTDHLSDRRLSTDVQPTRPRLGSYTASIRRAHSLTKMALSLKISLDGGKVVKTTQFDPSTTVYDACRIIREKNPDICTGEPKDYGLFLVSDEEAKKGIWLEASRNLDYYILRNGDVLEYNKKIRNLRVRMLDGTVKTLLVDDSQVVANLMVVICTKIGITNYDEYGLVREECKEEPDPCDKPHYGTLTLRRKHQDNKDRDVKMDMLRKKLRTDDEVNWVEPGKTLREQGVELSETLLLRRKLFFSDRNVDSRDPVQLNLLYVQARDAILDDTHPVTCDKACEFAGIQCQIQFGDHKEDKHTPGFLDLKEFLPTSYVKVKGIEKKVFREHRRHIGLSELDAKVLYTKSARALNTYGVAFFLVKEKMKGKNKLVPRLLGVSKDSVLRLDEKTKEPLQSWPLTTVRRWCASPNTFTLDFGDYSDQYYSVQTTEAEQILQVIAGYIDIILRKQRAKDHLGIEGDEGSAMMEDSVAPSKAHIIQHDTLQAGKVAHTECVAQPGVLRQPSADQKSYAMSHLTGAQHTTVSGQIITGHTPPTSGQAQQSRVSSVLSEPQRALLSTISSGREVIRQTETELIRAEVPDLGHDAASLKWKQVTLDSNKQAVTSHIAAMNAATAQVVTLTSGPTEEVDHTAVGAAITTITSNLPEMTKGVQMIAALMDDSDGGDKLLDATRKLCSAFSDLLRAAEPETKEPRQNLLNAASRVGEASTSVLHSIDEHPQDNETQDILLSLAKAVANTTAALVLRAKHVAAQCRDTPQAQHDIIAAATHCALATSQLVACTKVVASTLQSPQCRAQLAAAARLVSSAVDRLLSSAETSPSSAELNAAAAEVSAALQRLLRHASLDDRTQASETEVSVENVMSATERLVSAGDAAEMVRQARLLGQASAHLITSIKTDAEKQPSEMQRKLLAAAKLLADATASMVEAARQCASAPQDRVKQEALRKAAEELRYITVDYAQGQDIVGTQITRLQETAKQAASSATQLITTAHNAAVYNTNKYSQETLHQECASLSSVLPRVNQAIIASATAPSPSAHLELISASESMLPPSGHAISAARATIPSLDNAACAKRLTATANDYTQACADLRSAVSRARISCKGLEIDAAIEIINSLQKELDMLQDCELRPLPGQDSAWAYSTISHSTRSAAAATAQLVSGARHTSPAAPAAADLAAALRDYAAGVGAAAAAHPNQRERLFSTSRQVLYNSQRLVELIKTYTSTSEQVDISTVTSVANSITQSMEKTLEAIPSHQELDMVTENINETLNIISMGEFPPSDRSYGELQEELQSAATQLNSASSDVVASVDRTRSLATAAQNYGDAYNRLVGCAAEMAAQQEDHDVQTTMVNCMKTVTVTSSKLLTTAKSVSQDLSRPNAKNQLAAAARDVTDAINQLVDVCTEASPTQRECEKAILRIQSAKPLLHDPTQAVTSLGYFASLDAVIDQSKGLSDGMSGMASSAKHSSPEQFAVAVRTVADSVCGLVECTAQAAYLVGISDETSVAGRPGLVDQAQFSRAALAIQQACRALSDTHASQQQVLSAATVIAKHTSALCNACRVASSKTTEAAPKRHFVQAAKDVANSTAALVKEIKMLDHDYNEVNRKSCAAATVPLQEAVRSLCQFADCPEFSAIPAKISAQAQENQRPMLDIGRNIITASCSMIEAGRAVALQPTDRVQWQSLADNSKHVSDSIKALVNTIREKAPGQRECTVATESLRAALREVDSAALAALAQNLPPRNAYTLQEYSSQIENSATEMLERVDPLRIAAKSEAENLGHAVTLIVSYVDPLVQWCVGAASLLTTEGASGEILDKTKTVLESLAALVMAAKHSAGNPRATGAHPEVDEASRDLHSALQELRTAGRTLSTQHGHVQQLLDTLSANVARVTSHRLSLIGGFDETDSFVDYQTRMMACLKELVALSTDMNAAAVTNPSRLTDIGTKACALYEKIARDGSGAAQVHQLGHVGERIRTSVVELGEALQEAIRCGARCRMSSTAPTQRDMSMACKTLSEKAVAVLSTLQAGSKGTQACIEAAAKIAAVMGDLETTILFASAGTLQAEQDGAFSEHREGILQTAKRLVEDTKKLVGGANAPHDRLAAAAMDSTVTMVELAEVVKLGASVLGPSVSELQVSLLHAARDVSAALRDLCSATAAAAADKSHTPALRDAAKRSTKRWSLPAPKPVASRPQWRRSMNVNNTSCDSETDVFNSDQEDELLKLQDYSSHDDDVSPSLFYDNCEEVVAYIEKFMLNPHRMVIKDEDLNERYNLTSRNSLMNMEWRVLKYGENIMLGEVRKFIDLVVDIDDKMDQRKTKDKMLRVKANDYLDNEMKRLSQVVEDLDSEMETETEVVKEITTTTISTMTTDVPHKKPKLENKSPETNLSSPVFKVKKVRPVSLNINLDVNIKKISEHTPTEPIKNEPIVVEPESPEQTQKDEATAVIVKPEIISKAVNKTEFWQLFTDDSERWKELAKRNLKKIEQNRLELQHFIDNEMVIGDIEEELSKYSKEKYTLQTFIDEVDESKIRNQDLEYDKKYEEIVLKLIAFAKKDINYKGFDPIIEKLKALSNLEIEPRRKKVVNIQEIINVYSQIDITKYTYEELCLLETYYKEIIRKYNHQNNVNKENLSPREIDPNYMRETKSASPAYHRNVILNLRSSENSVKNINQYTNSVTYGGSLNRSHSKRQKQQNNLEIFDLTRTYPIEYYANNWWSIYEDVLRNREQQYGSIDNWWRFYEAVQNKSEPDDIDLRRLRSVVKHRMRPQSRAEEQLKMLDEIHHDKFRESEDLTLHHDDSVMVTNVTSLLKTVKAVEDEHTRGLRALEATIEAIGQEITVLLSSSAPIATSTPSDLIRATRHMTAATARSATATTQDQYVAAANLGRKTVLDLLRACKSVAFNLDDQSHRSKVISAGQGAAAAFRALLMGVLRAGHDPQAKSELPDLARDVAAAVADITATVDTLKGSDWVDPDDPAVIAESELLGAAASIDAAAKKLEALRPRKSIKVQEADETLNFDEMILEAAKSIIAASSALVRAASASQRELIDQGKVSRRPSAWSDDGQWSEGLVSAARLVSAGAHALAESANALVQGLGSEERLISSATHVASCTAQLLVACKVKADPSSESTRRLQSAGAEVIRSTDNLVRAAKNAIRHEDERSLVLNRKMVGGIAQEIDARSEVLRIEKELEEARGRLSAIRQAKYKLKTGETSGEETDTDVYVGGYTSDSSAPHRYKNTSFNTTNNTSFGLNTTYSPNSTYSPKHNTTTQSIQQLSQSIHGSPYAYSAPEYNQHQYTQTVTSSTPNQNGGYVPKSPQTTFSSFKPAPQAQDDTQKQNYEGFTTRYETRLYDTPRPVHDYSKTEEQKQFESTQYNYSSSSHEQKSATPKLASPLSPKFNARDLKFEDSKSDFYSTVNKPSTPKFGDGIGQNFTETQRSTEVIPGGTKHTEYTIKSEAYSSFPKTEYIKSDTKEIKSPFVTSTPNKFEKTEYNQYAQRSEQSSFGKTTSSDLVRVVTPDRMTSPYGKEVQSYGGPNYTEETTTEVKDIPNGTQKITTTKVYSSSPVTMTTTNTKYEPIKLEGIDELSKSFDDESRYSTLDSKVSSDTSRSFLRPSDFHSNEYQTSVVKVKKPSELVKELDAMDKKFSKQTITSETIERRSVMTSSKKSETSSTVTKKFGNA